MRILMLADRMEGGGAETHVECLAAGLVRLGHSVAVLSGGGRIAERMAQKGIVQYGFRWSDRPLVCHWRMCCALRSVLKKYRFDVLHAHTRKTAFSLRILWKTRIRMQKNALTVVTVHAAFSCTPLLRWLCYWGDRTVAVSEDLRARVCDLFGVPAEVISVIPNGVDEEKFCPSETLMRPSSVLFASRLDGDCSMGAELLCRIAPTLRKKHPALQIRIAGGGERLEDLRRLAAEANLQSGAEVVVLLGNVANMAAEYGGNEIFVGVSRAAVEAALSGCAVVLCGNEGWGGILTPQNPMPAVSNFCCRGEELPTAANLQDVLLFLLENPAHRRELASSARKWMLEEFTAARMAEATEAVYRIGGRG